MLLPLVGTRFQILFHHFLRVLFTFPLRYWFAIGLPVVLGLPDGAGGFRQGFTGLALLRILLGGMFFSLTGLSPAVALFSKSFG